jgi:hypothetical protein
MLVLQLALLGPAAACAAPTMTPEAMHAMPDMPGAVAPDASRDSSGGDEGCRMPPSAYECATVACAPVVLAPALAVSAVAVSSAPSARIDVEPSALESGSSTAPELPPPRA